MTNSKDSQPPLTLEESHLPKAAVIGIGVGLGLFPLLLPFGMNVGDRAAVAWAIAAVIAMLFEMVYAIAIIRSSYRRVVIDDRGLECTTVFLVFGEGSRRLNWEEIRELECKHLTGSESDGALLLTVRLNEGRDLEIFRDSFRAEMLNEIERACTGRPLVQTSERLSVF